MVYDVANRASFNELEEWLAEAANFGAGGIPTVVFANKVIRDVIEQQQRGKRSHSQQHRAMGHLLLDREGEKILRSAYSESASVFIRSPHQSCSRSLHNLRPRAMRRNFLGPSLRFADARPMRSQKVPTLILYRGQHAVWEHTEWSGDAHRGSEASRHITSAVPVANLPHAQRRRALLSKHCMHAFRSCKTRLGYAGCQMGNTAGRLPCRIRRYHR